MKKLIIRYKLFVVMILILTAMWIFYPEIAKEANKVIGFSFKEMLLVIPPVFILLGLLDVWVSRDTMIRYMGEDSGIKGVILAFIIGSSAAGPLYGAFPVAAVFMKKGVKFSNIMIFIGAWSTTKIPMLLFEMSSLGWEFMLTRLLVDIPGIIIIAFLLSKATKKEERERIYQNAQYL